MSSGRKTEQFNTQERALSVDLNRLQAFSAADSAEMFRYMINVSGNDDIDAGAVITENTSLASPLSAEIINGLLVRPVGSTLSLTVDAGVVMAIAPDSDPDASNFKFVKYTGLAAGTIAMTANASGSTRIDVIECQYTNVVVETDNRDIFDPVTGTFSATAVTKAVQGTLTFRVRTGTPAGGFPGTSTGWMPLAVASVPTGTTTNDTITFWDVRPLISDRKHTPFRLTYDMPPNEYTQVNAPESLSTIIGMINAVLGSRRIGGRIRRGTPGTDAESLNVTDAANQEPGIVFTPNRPWYLYMLVPFGLPRWARYTDGPLNRQPRSPRGIPVVSMTPTDSAGRPSAAIALPTSTGLGSSTTTAVCVYCGYTTAGGGQEGANGDSHSGYILTNFFNITGEPLEKSPVSTSSGFGQNTIRYQLTAGTDFPTHARQLLLESRLRLLAMTTQNITAFWVYSNGLFASQIGMDSFPLNNGGGNASIRHAIWLPVPIVYPTIVAPGAVYSLEIRYNNNGVGTAPTSDTQALRILGWKV